MAVAYKCVDGSFIGLSALAGSDAAALFPLGTITKGIDTSSSAYGEAEFQYVKFNGTVAAGDGVAIDRASKTAVQASTSAAKGSIGIAMAAQVANNCGWVLIRGIHDSVNVTTGVTAGTSLFVSGVAGRFAGSGAANKVDGSFERLVTASSNVGTVEFEWPQWTGNS